MATYILPAVMSRGIVSMRNLDSSATALRIWNSGSPNNPQTGARGFLMLARSGNPLSIFIGTSAVTISGANQGLPLAASDQLSGAIDGAGATEIFQIAADAAQDYLILEVA